MSCEKTRGPAPEAGHRSIQTRYPHYWQEQARRQAWRWISPVPADDVDFYQLATLAWGTLDDPNPFSTARLGRKLAAALWHAWEGRRVPEETQSAVRDVAEKLTVRACDFQVLALPPLQAKLVAILTSEDPLGMNPEWLIEELWPGQPIDARRHGRLRKLITDANKKLRKCDPLRRRILRTRYGGLYLKMLPGK